MSDKQRLDIACVKQGLFESRERALRAIMAGLVSVNGQPADKAGQAVREGDVIELVRPDCPYVSRGGVKLKGGLDNFKISVKDKVCLDVGVATGGFTDCFLQEGAKKVYAVDVGAGQLHEKIKNNPKTVFIPETNARFLKSDLFPETPELAAIDVSFISLKLILGPVFDCLVLGGEVIALVKPQFELEPRHLYKGIVKTEEFRQKALADLREFVFKNIKSVEEKGLIDSPIKGAKGNLEFLWYLKRLR
jgi:23S rRNA (cytidine1920-2'-O)/16S rRNA (cytidine1409-2'-O)-methyltransferase